MTIAASTRALADLRCPGCRRLLLRSVLGTVGVVEVKCSRCKTTHTFRIVCASSMMMGA